MRRIAITFLLLTIFCSVSSSVYSEDGEVLPTPKTLIVSAWEAWGAKDYESTFQWTNQCIELYAEEAKKQQSFLRALPSTQVMDDY
ncbi:MAG: hypothetical protein QGI05_04585, partial [Candidatus Omnitrophota bacterium]|nr:hypothetical protein [Candidatus Omnitrophota bacterium]